ncbi:unnamed protein product [Bursaphelenchus xylophilus]|uniref:(pine wood nematode) hypothetical protein n=1 Tax=Bursaphelenchus xylophilus TaxID=6326 RepID=A0A1I7SFI3_BURXY|nr:unnamed protein product [Bursaphelenchus xylophilus]CAG9079071.1 unnamed protein product [Bursaphelenchus xylophilus]
MLVVYSAPQRSWFTPARCASTCSSSAFEPMPPRPCTDRRLPIHPNREESLRRLVLVHSMAKKIKVVREEEERQRRKMEQKRRVQHVKQLKTTRSRAPHEELLMLPKRPHLEVSLIEELCRPCSDPLQPLLRSSPFEDAASDDMPPLIQSVVDFLMDA